MSNEKKKGILIGFALGLFLSIFANTVICFYMVYLPIKQEVRASYNEVKEEVISLKDKVTSAENIFSSVNKAKDMWEKYKEDKAMKDSLQLQEK